MYSEEHKKFIRQKKITKFLVVSVQLLIIALFIIIWQALANKKLINTFIFSSPLNILNTIISLYKAGNLWGHIFITLYEILLSFILCTIIGFLIAALLYNSDFLSRVLDPYLTVLNSLPKVALGPIIIIWFGARMNSVIIMAVLTSLITTIIYTYQSFMNTPKIKIKLMKSFKASKTQIFIKLVIPNSYKSIISTLKINLSLSLIGVIMGEFLVSKKGIGYLITYGSQVFNLNLVMTGIFLLLIISAILYYIILYIEKSLLKN